MSDKATSQTSANAPIRVAINGYGNLGRGVELAAQKTPDIEVVTVFTRRDPASLTTLGAPVHHVDNLHCFEGKLDVVINCGGSATDLIDQTPQTTTMFNTVDTFDTHARIPEHFARVDAQARAHDRLTLISTGWDPGLFSLMRCYFGSVLPDGDTYTFWGRGVSQGHGDALRRVPGVANAVQYTVPVEENRQRILGGEHIELTTRAGHRRVCYIVPEDGADLARIQEEIVTMPMYFDQYDTEVNFITAEELARDHSGMPHGGSVIRLGNTSRDTKDVMSFNLDLGSNPEFTGSVALASARAVARLYAAGQRGAITVLDVPPSSFSPKTPADLRATLL